MKKNKAFVLITTVVAVFAFAGLAFGANTANVTVTSEPIEQGTACSKAGGFAIEFDSGTVLAHGDQITADLDLGVTLCTAIDLEISAGGSGGTWGSTLLDGAAPPATGAPVVDPTGAATSHATDGGVYFRISGTEGSARITIDVIGVDVDADLTNNAALTVGPGVDDKLIIYFLDQQTNDDFLTEDGIYVEGDVAGTCDVAAEVADNTICVDVSAYGDNTVDANIDSKDDKYTFVPSDPQVAHIIAAKAYRLRACKDATTENITLGSTTDQGGDDCDAIDFEAGDNYCDTFAGRLIIESQSAAFDQSNYEITLEILVNDQEGELGVYWTNQDVNADGHDTLDEACDDVAAIAVGAAADYTYYDEDGETVAAGTIPAPNVDECDVEVDERAVVLVTDSSTLSLDASNDFLWIDMPALNYDLDQIVEGDVLSVRVTLTKAPCTQVYQGTIELGTFGCAEEVLGANGLIYPYFTPMSDTEGVYWDGIAIVNLGAVDGTATLYIYEQDGDQATMDVSVGANSMYVNLLSDMVSGMTLTQTVEGTLGNSRVYIIVCTDFTADGFAMIAKESTGESMGYLPRQPSSAPDVCGD
jgi:hypothetical protein